MITTGVLFGKEAALFFIIIWSSLAKEGKQMFGYFTQCLILFLLY